MSQRIKKAMDRKATINVGGNIVAHSREGNPEVMGLAKASPLFKKFEEEVIPASKAEEAKAIAENSVPQEGQEEETEEE